MSEPWQPSIKSKERPFLWIGILSALTVIGSLWLYLWYPAQGYGPSHFPVGTRFPPDYTEEKFRLVREGMSHDEVRDLLGESLTIYRVGLAEQWHYAEDTVWWDSRWLMRMIDFNEEGIVIRIGNALVDE